MVCIPAGASHSTEGDRMQKVLIAALSLSLMSCAVDDELSDKQSEVDAPDFVSASGITVTAVRWITPRTLEVDISTAFITPFAVNGPHRLRVTLPSNYFQQPAARF